MVFETRLSCVCVFLSFFRLLANRRRVKKPVLPRAQIQHSFAPDHQALLVVV